MGFHKAKEVIWSCLRVSKQNSDLDRVDFLRKMPFFESLSRWQLKRVADYTYERIYQRDEYIFEIGQAGAALFLILDGEVSIEIPDNDNMITIARLKKTDFFGDLALLDNSERSASAKANTHTKCLALFRNDLERMLKEEPEISCHIYKSLASIIGERLKSMNELVESQSVFHSEDIRVKTG